MRALRLTLPTAEFSISAPAEILNLLRIFYPHSLSPQPIDGTLPHFSLLPDADVWHLEYNGSSLGAFARPSAALLALEYRIETDVAGVDDGRIAIHAGAVATTNGAWLLAGDPDSGKTSSTFQLLELGQSFLCEEIAIYDPVRREVHPYLQTLSLNRRYVDLYRSSRSVEAGSVHELDENLSRYLPHRVETSPQRLSALLLPRYRPHAIAGIEELPAAEALTEVLGYCFQPSAGEERLFDALIDLLDTVTVLRVTYRDMAEARDLYSGLLTAPLAAGT